MFFFPTRAFRSLVKIHQDQYLKAKKRDKPMVAALIVEAVRKKGGRFLRRHVAFGAASTQSVWQAIQDPEEMMTKVKQ